MSQKERGEIRLPTRREDFGPGRPGEIDYSLILTGASCESFIDKDHNMCGKSAVRVLDFDSATSTEQLPICSDACEKAATELITADGLKREKIPAMGINGWGRS